MTQEQKAKAYDEAIERAKTLYNSVFVNNDVLEQIFPELKESEDEKIRKELIAFLKENHETGRAEETWSLSGIERWIAWLEKQKEPDGTWTEEDDAKVKVMCKEGDLKPSERAWLKELKNRIVKKEQKPVHTAKEMWKEMRLEVYAQASGNRHEPNYSDDSTKMFSLCDIDEIFEKIGNSTVESQPVEWSDTDMKEARDNIISACRDWERGEQTTFLPIAAARARYFLEHLTEPKQEWSEEDESMLNLIVTDVRLGQRKCGVGTDEWNARSKAVRWLKSLPNRFNFQPQAQPEQEPTAKLTGWVARDRDGRIWVYETCPEKYSERGWWRGDGGSMLLDEKSFPNIKWETGAVEVEVTIKKKNAEL